MFKSDSFIFSKKQEAVSSETETIWGISKPKKNRDFENP